MLKQNCHLACSGPNGKGFWLRPCSPTQPREDLNSAAQNLGAFIKRLFISLSTRLPGSLLEVKILFGHRISCSTRGPRNRRSSASLGMTKEGAAVHKECLLNRGTFQIQFGQVCAELKVQRPFGTEFGIEVLTHALTPEHSKSGESHRFSVENHFAWPVAGSSGSAQYPSLADTSRPS
jgi:hypothetical protein